MIVAALLLLWGCSIHPVSSFLACGLEQAYPPVTVNVIAPADAIIVLGGGVIAPADAGAIPTKQGSARYRYAARLFHAGKAPLIVAVGGPPRPNKAIGALSSEEILEFLVYVGVPREAIMKAPDGANTVENALFAKPIVEAYSFRRVLLVTSALHMPRAVAIFRAAGIDVTPVSSDAGVTPGLRHTWSDFLPDPHALRQTKSVLREYLGMLVYPLQMKFARQGHLAADPVSSDN